MFTLVQSKADNKLDFKHGKADVVNVQWTVKYRSRERLGLALNLVTKLIKHGSDALEE